MAATTPVASLLYRNVVPRGAGSAQKRGIEGGRVNGSSMGIPSPPIDSRASPSIRIRTREAPENCVPVKTICQTRPSMLLDPPPRSTSAVRSTTTISPATARPRAAAGRHAPRGGGRPAGGAPVGCGVAPRLEKPLHQGAVLRALEEGDD